MNRRIRTLIVDDEPLARAGIRLLLEGDPEIEVVGECGDGAEAARAISRLNPDLVFLDVQMPEADGFEALARARPARLPLVVFVTAYDAYAVRAFEVRAVDYLLKPFDDERFRETLRRVKARIREGGNRHLNRLVVRRAGRVLLLEVERIDWIEAADYYVRLHADGQAFLLRMTMKELQRWLDPEAFFRIHRSAIVRLDFIQELRPEPGGEYSVVLKDGTSLSLSRSGRRLLEERIGQRL